jgi:RNA polymerase sigma-70 factor, ECF subfamily
MVLVLHDMEELSTGEVAQVTGLRPGTVRVRLHRARVFLRNQLARKAKPVAARSKTQPSARCKRLFALLSDYLDQEIDPSLCDGVKSHLGDCSPCKTYLASLEETIHRCRRHCTEEVKAEVRAKVRELIREAARAKAGG